MSLPPSPSTTRKRSRTSAPVPAARAARMFQPHRESDGLLLRVLAPKGTSTLPAGSNLKDPKYDSLSPSERDSQAIEIHHHRLARIAARCPSIPQSCWCLFRPFNGLPIELWLTCLNQELAYGIPTYEHMLANSTSSSIIDLFMSKPPMPYASMQVHSSLSLGSPHKAISLTFPSISPVLSPPSHPRRLWNLSRLREHEVRSLYEQHVRTSLTPLSLSLQSLLSSPPSSMPDIESLTDTFLHAIHSSLDQSIGSKPP
ncbi:hypothetical protein BD560DRAFT_494528 [Blakeslea trispora]|nr:hypothetical protein BD560DRAFT_494528 [Blakeslea trispora]